MAYGLYRGHPLHDGVEHGGWLSVSTEHITPMMASGLIGIFIGDTALFACLNRMGPRQAGLLFSCHAVFSAILGYFLFSESMTGTELIGATLVFSGVVMAIFYGRRGQASNALEEIKGNVWIGIGLGLTAAMCQALGGIIAKPVMQTTVDPVARLCHSYDQCFRRTLCTLVNWRQSRSRDSNHHMESLWHYSIKWLFGYGDWYDIDSLRTA